MIVFIAEDEPLAAAKLKLFLEKLGEGGDVTLFSDGEKLMSALAQGQIPDVLFMDIQMPHLTGLDVLRKIDGASSFPIVLTTAYDRYAIDGFNFGVTDYLLKPYTLDRLRQAMQKVQTIIDAHKSRITVQKATQSASITVRCDGRNELVDIASIESLEAFKDYTCLSLSDGRKLTTLGTLTSFEQQLPTDSFCRVQRSYIVNLRKVQSYNTHTLRLTSGLEIPIGKTYRDSFIETVLSLT